MAGVKGRSGRKTLSNEEYKLSTIEECWRLVREAINNPDLDYEYRVELASRHTVKSIPTELSGGITTNIVAMGTIVKNDNKIEFNIGSKIDEIDGSDPPEDSQHT